MMKAKLVNLGRAKFNGELLFKSMNQLNRAIQSHLMSRGWYLSFEDGATTASVVAGFHTVGTVELTGGKFRNITEQISTVEEVDNRAVDSGGIM